MIGGRMSAQGVGWALKALGRAKEKESLTKKSSKTISKPAKEEISRKSTKVSKQNLASHSLDNVPWQRVVNAQGGTSTHKIAEIPPGLQQHLLEAEGIIFNDEGKMDLDKYLWMEGIRDSHRM